MASLDARWTTRVMVPLHWILVRRGPCRWLRCSNYAIVAAEIVIPSAAFGARALAASFGIVNLVRSMRRIAVENDAVAR